MKFAQGIYEYQNREDLTRQIWDSIRETGLTFLGVKQATNMGSIHYHLVMTNIATENHFFNR